MRRLYLLAIIVVVVAISGVAGQILGIRVNSTATVGSATSPTWFNHIIVIAMENQNYGSVIGSPSAPFINGLAALGTTVSNYHSYGQNIGGCSAGCYEAFSSGQQSHSDGWCPRASSPCYTISNVADQLSTAGLTSAMFCEDGCPRGADHFPWIAYTSTWNTCVTGSFTCTGQTGPDGNQLYASSSSNGNSAFINYLNGGSPANFIWFTPTDSHNMHDNSVSSGDAYLDTLLTGTGTIQSPAPGSVLASNLFKTPGTFLYLWWDEYDPSPNVEYGSMIKIGTSTSGYDEYNSLHTIEQNWGLPYLTSVVSGDSAMTDLFASGPPPPPGPLTASFTVTPTTLQVGSIATFTPSVSGGTSPYSYKWSFGDGTANSTSTAPTHSYGVAGTFTASLTVTDTSSPAQSSKSSASVVIATQPPPPPPPGQAPLINGWATGIGEVQHTTTGNPQSQVFPGTTASNFETAILTMQTDGYNGVRLDFDSTCGNTGSFPQSFTAANLATSIQVAQHYNFWIIIDYHSYNDIFNSQSCWLSFWQGVVSQYSTGYSRIVWEPENEPAYGQATTCSGSAACLPVLASAYNSFISQTRGLGDTHWIVIQNICSYGCGITATGGGDASGALNGWPTVTDSANHLLYSLHAYMQIGNSACGSNTFTLAYAQCDAQAFATVVTSAMASGKAILNTESGADEFSNLGGCGFSGGQPPQDVILCGSAGYSNVTYAFVSTLNSLYKAGGIGSLWWTAGDWTNTPGAGPLGALQCAGSPQGWGCLMVNGGTPPPPPKPLSASFTFSPTSPTVGITVSFTAIVTGGVSGYTFAWNFGDSGTSTTANPTHAFTTAATFTVLLTVKDSASPQNTATASNAVFTVCPAGTNPPTCTPIPPTLATTFTAAPASPYTGQIVTFYANATGGVGPYSFSWNFGDGNSGTGKTVTHTYGSAGSFPVMLTTTDSATPQDSATATFNGTPATCSSNGLSIIVTSCPGSPFPTWVFIPIAVGVAAVVAVVVVKRRH